MRIGAKLPGSGPLHTGIVQHAVALERAGFDSLWVSDHIVMPRTIASRYPFAPDGRATWPTDTPYLDALIALALAAAVTTRVRLGTAALVLPQRNPVLVAKQAASIDVVSGGRLELGIGAGWLAEEFEALDVPFERRGARMDEWISVLRECWTGTPRAFAGEFYSLPADMLCLPAPAHEIPLLVGGHSPAALRRARATGAWLAQQDADKLDPAELAAFEGRVVLRVIGPLRDAQRLRELEDAGVDEVIVDAPVDEAGAAAVLEALR